MIDPIVVAGANYQHGEAKRNPRIPLQDQLESLAEDYEGFDWISVSSGVISFVYLRERSD